MSLFHRHRQPTRLDGAQLTAAEQLIRQVNQEAQEQWYRLRRGLLLNGQERRSQEAKAWARLLRDAETLAYGLYPRGRWARRRTIRLRKRVLIQGLNNYCVFVNGVAGASPGNPSILAGSS